MWVQGLRQRQAFCVGVTMRKMTKNELLKKKGLHLLAPLFSLFGIPWVLLQSVEKVLCGWHENFDALSWNVRGETKIKETSTGLVRSLGVGRHLDRRAVNSRGATGELCGWVDVGVHWCVWAGERSKGGGLSASMRRFSEVGILPRPVSDHFPILLEGGEIFSLNLEDCEARKEARESYKTWVLREEISWRQKSR
ncbi:hypothetical protein CK203_046449 [Vitis vinifera]|uniref:Uncharacterized protein n=1 Tax=Vitis vinifera TaxID=29760 RepID=A0A438I1Y9_VITVI|nr:hypothetical protein CK203_046449 [Vitis vinifera]